MQRLSTLFEFMGILKDENGDLITPLALEKTKYLPSLEGKKWDDPNDKRNSFSTSQRLCVKRAKFDVSIILRESEAMAKYELFQRLNTGGSPFSDQEVRNCIIVMLDRDFYIWLRDLALDTNFQNCISLTDKAISEQYDMELALRFIIFRSMKSSNLTRIGDLGEFLTDEMVKIIRNRSFNRDKRKLFFAKALSP